MELKKTLGLIAFVYVFTLTACTEENEIDDGYIFTSPRSFKIGSYNQLQMLRFGNFDEGTLKVQLYYTESYKGNETLAQEQDYQLEKGKKETLIKFFVDPFENNNVYNGRLQINGTIGSKPFSGSDRVQFSSPKTSIYIIQTDKPLYQPGQEVNFRVLKLDHKLRPSDKETDIADVFVEDPKRTRLFQFKGVHLGQGIKQMKFPLAEEPVQGSWTITVQTANDTETTSFDVKEYVLPKFDVTINFPSFVLANAKEIPVSVCAKYTYGKPVVGTLNLNSSLEKYSYSYSRDKSPVLQESLKIDGCYNYTLNVSLIDPGNSYRYRRIMVVANVIEKGTGVERNTTQYLQRQYSPLNLNFNSDYSNRQYYKPGLPYNGKLQVNNPDDTPAPNEPIEICYTVSRERIIAGWKANKKVKFCKNYTSDDSGNIRYTVPPQNTDSTSVLLEAKSLKYARDVQSGPDSLSQPISSMSLSPFYSPSGSFIQLANTATPIPCGTEKHIRLLFTAKENTEFKLIYQVIRQGKIVQTKTQDVSFNVEDDVSSKFENDDELINDSETQLVPTPKATESSSSSSSSSSNEEDCTGAREARYTPFIGEVEIPVDVDATLSSSLNLLVFYVKEDSEIVADSQKVEVEKCFKNKVDFEFGDEVKQPGTKTSVQITSSPNSLCGIKVVDKSVSLLDSNDQLTKDKIFQLIESMDPGIYYSTNPCNEPIPQPGLMKSSILPPGSYSSSSYEDSYASFQDAGLLVISNLVIFTRPCSNNGGYGGRPVYPESSFEQFDAPGGAPVALASAARRPVASPQVAVAKVGAPATKSAVEVRDYFPETWLFELQMTGPDGVYASKETLPHTITEWVGSAVCVNSEDGLGLSNATTIKGFQAFFISYTLPYSAIRGEEFTVVVSIFSYVDKALPVMVSLDEPEGFEVSEDSVNGNVCIQPNTNANLKLKLKGTTVGSVNITVRAETASSDDVCGDSPVYGSLAKDAIKKSLEIEAEGFPNEQVHSILFCPTDEENQMFTDKYTLSLPEDVVPDSARALVDVTGNVLGPAIQNLNNLVALPTGCGEQNMVKFTPNYLVLDYLKGIDKLTDNIKNMAIRNLNTGYQRELNYRHDDGSFSAFGVTDKEGSMFLTAFVLRSFHEAQRYITIDGKLLKDMQNWITARQQADGCFPNVGQIIDSGIQGGLEKEKNTGAITAYVAASLLISKFENETIIENALSCLEEDSNLTPYETFLYAYAEALAGKTDEAQKRIDDIKPRANTTEGVEYYRNPNGTKAVNIETAAYAVLTNLQIGNTASDVLPLVRYLTSNLNPNGGFHSTQDTCVGLGGLSEFAKLVYKDPVDIMVTISGGLDEKVEITQDNKLLVQRNMVTEVPSEINIEATGSGCGLIQTTLRYNTNTPPEKQKFFLEVTGECSTSDCKKKKITVIVSYIPSEKAAGMSVVQIKMVTGTVPVKDTLDQLKADTNNKILRIDVEDNNVIVYFSEINNNGQQFSFDVEEVVAVDNPQPGTAKVFDYYAPENTASTSYTFEDSGSPDNSSPKVEP